MKRTCAFFVLLVLVFWPSNLQAKKIYMKVSTALISGGGITDSWPSYPEYDEFVSVSCEKHSRLGQDLFMEFFFYLNSNFGFSIGSGYIHKTLRGKTSEYIPANSFPPFEPVFNVYPEFAAEAIPICLSSVFSFSLGPSIDVNLTGGVGYYFIKYEERTEWSTMFPSGPYNRTTYNFKQESNQIGYHFSAGVDVKFSLNMLLSIDVVYRIVDLKNLESLDLSGEMWITSDYLQQYMGEDITGAFDYQISEASLTGLSVRMGIKFQF